MFLSGADGSEGGIPKQRAFVSVKDGRVAFVDNVTQYPGPKNYGRHRSCLLDLIFYGIV
jgi:hypothetical protein